MELTNYLPVMLIIIMAVGFGIVNIVASGLLGPKRSGDVKDDTYESGMKPIGSARKRFNIRFYILAMTFLVFDIEIIFLYPWALGSFLEASKVLAHSCFQMLSKLPKEFHSLT